MTGNEILSVSKVGDLFPNDLNSCKAKYKSLAKVWHPDVNTKDTSDIFSHITKLYEHALVLLDKHEWERDNYIQLTKRDGSKVDISYLTSFPFEWGMCYVCTSHLIYKFNSTNKKYFDNTLKVTSSFKYANDGMKKVISDCIPNIISSYEVDNGDFCIVMTKTEDVYPLRLVLNYFNNKIDSKYVAWMITRLSNLSCYLKVSGLVHNAITIDNCFVSLKYHSILLLGGWWFAVNEHEKMLGTTDEVLNLMSISTKTSKLASSSTDLECVKQVGRQLLGDKNISTLISSKLAPKEYIDFLVSGCSNDAIAQMTIWDKALNDSFGARKFIKIDVPSKQIYGKHKED